MVGLVLTLRRGPLLASMLLAGCVLVAGQLRRPDLELFLAAVPIANPIVVNNKRTSVELTDKKVRGV